MSAIKSRGRPRSFERDVALDEAVRVFWAKGYQAASIRDLSLSLGIGQPSLYNAFGNKAALFEEVVERYDRGPGGFVDDAITQESTAASVMRRILQEAPRNYTRKDMPPGCLIACGDAGDMDPKAHAVLVKVREAKLHSIASQIQRDVANGVLPADTQPQALAAYFMTVIRGLAQNAREGASRSELEAIAEIAVRAFP